MRGGMRILWRAITLLFASAERPGEARSYLARASAALSHELHARPPAREEQEGVPGLGYQPPPVNFTLF